MFFIHSAIQRAQLIIILQDAELGSLKIKPSAHFLQADRAHRVAQPGLVLRLKHQAAAAARAQMLVHFNSSPVGSCPDCKKVLISSPSPQTVMPENFLNHLPAGTSGSVSSQRANRTIWPCEIPRWRVRMKRCRNKASGNFWRRTLGMRFVAVKSAHQFFFQSVCLCRVFCFNHLPGQFAQFLRGKLPAFT